MLCDIDHYYQIKFATQLLSSDVQLLKLGACLMEMLVQFWEQRIGDVDANILLYACFEGHFSIKAIATPYLQSSSCLEVDALLTTQR